MDKLTAEIDLQNPASNHFYFWRKLGLIPPKGPLRKKITYILLSIIFHMFVTIPFPLFLSLNSLEANNLIDFCSSFYLVIPCWVTVLKFLFTAGNIDKLHLIVRTGQRLIERAKLVDIEYKEILKSMEFGQKFSKIIFKFVFVIGVISLTVVLIIPNIIPVWFPLDWRANNLNFGIYYIFMVTNVCLFTFMFILTNTYFLIYMCFYIGHMNCLGVRMQNLGHDPRKSVYDNEKEICECVKDHQDIIR